MQAKQEASDDDYALHTSEHASASTTTSKPGRKRRKTGPSAFPASGPSTSSSIARSLDTTPLDLQLDKLSVSSVDFESVLGSELEMWAEERRDRLRAEARPDENGTLLRKMTPHERQDVLFELASAGPKSPMAALITRKLESPSDRFHNYLSHSTNKRTIEPLPHVKSAPPPDEAVITALHAIRRTPFKSSLLSRLHGCASEEPLTAISVDWETSSPWMELMADIRDHYLLSHLDEEPIQESVAPIIYVTLSREHLPQVHDLLERTFWEGIDVSDSLIWEPEKCTVVATYKKLVVGIALLSEPQHTYVTYMVVKAGWENAHIATTMLYHLIKLNPGRHITLHVSTNNPAMILYNRFGFKAEQFVVGFYDAYLDPQSRASKNAFLLRLRP